MIPCAGEIIDIESLYLGMPCDVLSVQGRVKSAEGSAVCTTWVKVLRFMSGGSKFSSEGLVLTLLSAGSYNRVGWAEQKRACPEFKLGLEQYPVTLISNG